ncbi:restriction endonuclease [Microcoleus vaginatus GB1-A2]|uniref:restriction endonuclease n=1 Tax=Microcoleus vaginatus TaxID=119532 RepID=UPI0016887631|nr:restriction endonuclease [Microcoleus sp. FACHB-61]
MPTPSTSDLPKPKSWDEFEDITWEIYKQKWHDNHAQKYGRSGQAQNGIDIYGRQNSSGKYIGVQCKRYEDNKLNQQIIKEEIVKAECFSPPLSEYIIATTASRDTKLQDFVRSLNEERGLENKFPVYIVFWEDICNDLADPNNRDLLKKHYSSNWKEIFSEEKCISEQVASIHCLLSFEIQQDCNLLQELLNQNQYDLSEKWQSCFSQNRGVWRDISSRLLLARSSRELMPKIQKFYHQLDDIESRCKSLFALKSPIQPFESKPKYGGLHFDTMASQQTTESEQIRSINRKKKCSMNFSKLKEKVDETLNLGNQITCEFN